MKKSEKKVEQALTIEEITAIYAKFAKEEKTAKDSGKKYKEMIVDYAKTHLSDFDDKMLKLQNGVKVEIRKRLNNDYSEDKITTKWLDQILDTSIADAISVKLDAKVIVDNSSPDGCMSDKLCELLREINYSHSVSDTYAVVTA